MIRPRAACWKASSQSRRPMPTNYWTCCRTIPAPSEPAPTASAVQGDLVDERPRVTQMTPQVRQRGNRLRPAILRIGQRIDHAPLVLPPPAAPATHIDGRHGAGQSLRPEHFIELQATREG